MEYTEKEILSAWDEFVLKYKLRVICSNWDNEDMGEVLILKKETALHALRNST